MLLLLLLALAAAEPSPGLSEERARQILPRADLRALDDQQRAAFLEVAGDTFDYAGCNDTLLRCLAAEVKDRHAPRMAELVKGLLIEGFPVPAVIEQLERYYASFAPGQRQKLADADCPQLGEARAPVVVVEFADFECPHCAAAQKPLREMLRASAGKARLCSKHFPLPGHPHAQAAAACAESARQRGKFWEMSELLFSHQDQLDDGSLKKYAQELGLDGGQMLKEVYAGRYQGIIEKQKKEGADAGVRATPTLFFNGRQHTLPLKSDFLVLSARDEEEWQRNKGGWDKD